MIETLLRGHPLVSDAFVAGDRRPYLVALLTLDPTGVENFVTSRGGEASAPGVVGRGHGELIRRELTRWIAEVNERVSRVEQVKRFSVLDQSWEVDSDELTPTMKVKRQAVLEKFADEIERLYR